MNAASKLFYSITAIQMVATLVAIHKGYPGCATAILLVYIAFSTVAIICHTRPAS